MHILSLRRYASQGLTNGRISALHQVSEGTEGRLDAVCQSHNNLSQNLIGLIGSIGTSGRSSYFFLGETT